MITHLVRSSCKPAHLGDSREREKDMKPDTSEHQIPPVLGLLVRGASGFLKSSLIVIKKAMIIRITMAVVGLSHQSILAHAHAAEIRSCSSRI